jgi:hypothetical protein
MMKYTLTLLLLIFIIAGCKKSGYVSVLPQPTENGSNTMSCLINGAPYIFVKDIGLFAPPGLMFHPAKAGYLIDARARNDGVKLSMHFSNLDTSLHIGVRYPLVNQLYPASYFTKDKSENDLLIADTTKSFIVISKLQDSIISGSFEFHGADTFGHNVDITQGSFDIKYP